MTKRHRVIPCSALGGRSQKTGRRVGTRHRWSGDGKRKGWGVGICVFCFSELQQVLRDGEAAKG